MVSRIENKGLELLNQVATLIFLMQKLAQIILHQGCRNCIWPSNVIVFLSVLTTALMYVEGDDGNIYVANSLSPTSFRKLIDGKNVVDFAVGRKTYNKITFIDDQGDLYQADVSDTSDPAVTVSGYNQLYVGTKFKSVVSGFMGSKAAITQDNQFKIINPTVKHSART